MAEGIPEDLQRWTAKRRAALVLSILKGETSLNLSQPAVRRSPGEISLSTPWLGRCTTRESTALEPLHKLAEVVLQPLAVMPPRLTVLPLPRLPA